MKTTIQSLEDLHAFAHNFLSKLPQTTTATIVGLNGNLGAGKTTFVQQVGKVLNIEEKINSPTFVIFKNYAVKDFIFKNIIHVDAYRLENGEELAKLNWQEYASNSDNLIFIEWVENVKDVLPRDFININFEIKNKDEREVTVKW